MGPDDAASFLKVKFPDGIVYRVIGTPQCRVDTVHEYPIRSRITLFQVPFLIVRGTATVYDGQYLLPLWESASVYILPDSLPVLRSPVHLKQVFRKMILTAKPGNQCLRAPAGKHQIAVVGSVRGGIAMQGDSGNLHVRVILDRFYGPADLPQFHRIVLIAGNDHGTADGKVQPGTAGLHPPFDIFFARLDIGIPEIPRLGSKGQTAERLQRPGRQQGLGAPAKPLPHSQLRLAHPVLEGYHITVVDRLPLSIPSPDHQCRIRRCRLPGALVVDIPVLPHNLSRWQFQGISRIYEHRRKHQPAVCRKVQVAQVHIQVQQDILPLLPDRSIHHVHFRVLQHLCINDCG